MGVAEAAQYDTENTRQGNLLSSLASPGFDLNMALFNMQKSGAPHDLQEASVAALKQQQRILLLMGQQPQQSVPVAKKPPPPAARLPPQLRQWWVCCVCQSKAFALAEEAQ
eukprot:9341477-Ditylum_brightwellii.AAC.1